MTTLSDSNFYRKIIGKYLRGTSRHFRFITMVFRRDPWHTLSEIGLDILIKLKFHDQKTIYSIIPKNNKFTDRLFSMLSIHNLFPQFMLKPAILKNVQRANKIFPGIFRKIISICSQAYPLFLLHRESKVPMPHSTISQQFNRIEVDTFFSKRMHETELFRNDFFFQRVNDNVFPSKTSNHFYRYSNKIFWPAVDMSLDIRIPFGINRTDIFPQNKTALFYQHIFYNISFPGTTRSILDYYGGSIWEEHEKNTFLNMRIYKPAVFQDKNTLNHHSINYNFSLPRTKYLILNYYDKRPRDKEANTAFFDTKIFKSGVLTDRNLSFFPFVNYNFSLPEKAGQSYNYFNEHISAMVNIAFNSRTIPIRENRLDRGIFQNLNQNKRFMIYNYPDLQPQASGPVQNKFNIKQVNDFYYHDQRKMEEEIEQIKRTVVETKKEIKETSSMTNSVIDMKKLLDISHISNQVYEVIERKLRKEKERRGL